MTSELRSAVWVWRDATDATEVPGLEPYKANAAQQLKAAAVIEADREAVRAEQAAEVERLRKLIKATSAHFLRLNTDHPIMWEGAIDGAMEAVCLEVGRQTAELAKFKALAETLAGALEKIAPITVRDGPDYAEVYFADGKTHSTQAMTMNPQDWLDLSEALRQYKEARDAS